MASGGCDKPKSIDLTVLIPTAEHRDLVPAKRLADSGLAKDVELRSTGQPRAAVPTRFD